MAQAGSPPSQLGATPPSKYTIHQRQPERLTAPRECVSLIDRNTICCDRPPRHNLGPHPLEVHRGCPSGPAVRADRSRNRIDR